MSTLRNLALSLIFTLLAHGAWAACATTSLTFKDAAGATQTLCFGGSAGQFIGQSSITDNSGNIVGATSNALDVNLKSGTGSSLATSTKQSDGTQKSQIVDGSGNVIASTSNALNINVSSGTVTANAGTNLNTSALALETGGNLASLVTNTTGLSQGSTTSGQKGSLVQGAVTTGAPTYTTAQTSPLSLDVNGNMRVLQDAGCAGVSQLNTTYTPFSLASTTALKLVSKATSKKVYICSINIVSASANNVALIEGTHTTNDCDTSTAGLAGGTTAATGWNFAANGGLTLGNGVGIVVKSGSVTLDVCLLASGSGQVSGGITWAQF